MRSATGPFLIGCSTAAIEVLTRRVINEGIDVLRGGFRLISHRVGGDGVLLNCRGRGAQRCGRDTLRKKGDQRASAKEDEKRT